MRRNIHALALACVLALCGRSAQAQSEFPTAVAARCAGEARFALHECACVVKNRLLGGYTETNVLHAFYAADAVVSAAEVAEVERVLSGDWPCDPRLWFMLSVTDCRRLALPEAEALLTVRGPGQWRVLFYERGAMP